MMMNATTVLEARGWALNCCRILIEDMPMVACYNTMVNHAVRTDMWEGYIPMTGIGWIGNNPYTYQKIRLKEEAGGPFGCYPTEYVCVLSEGMDFTNAILSDSDYSHRIFMNIYDRLWYVDPYTWDKVPNLAWNWTVEPTTASGDIQDGMKYTFYLYENVTWHDGVRFTSEDVKYSLETIHPRGTYTYVDVCDIYRIDTLSLYTVEIYSTQPGYFGFSQATYPYIFPKHIWEPHENGNFTWSPQTPEDLTGSGCYKWVTRIRGQYVTLERYGGWHFAIELPPRVACPPPPPPLWILLLMLYGVLIILIQVLLLGFILYHRRKGQAKKEQ
jgi:hypothetical protein